MKKVVISKSAYGVGIINPVAALIKNIAVTPEGTELNEDREALMYKLSTNPEEILNRSEVRGFATLFSKLGYPEQVPAGHRLINSLIKRGFKSYNNIVDAYNIVSAEFGSGLGMHDAKMLAEDLCVFRADGTERITPLFKNDAISVEKGDLVYGSKENLLAWLGKKDVDSDKFKVTDETTDVFLIILGNSETSREYNTAVCERVFRLIKKTCLSVSLEFVEIVFDN